MYVPLAANTTQTTVGTVGSSLSVSVLTTTATINIPVVVKFNLIDSNAEMPTRRKSSFSVIKLDTVRD
jgi:hypothetical protein